MVFLIIYTVGLRPDLAIGISKKIEVNLSYGM
jgi:hypothetical protein